MLTDIRMEKISDKIFGRTFWGIYNLVDKGITANLSTYMYSKEADKKWRIKYDKNKKNYTNADTYKLIKDHY